MIWNFSDTSLEELEDDGRTPTGRSYHYDMVFGPHSTTDELYERQCQPIVNSAMDGFNGTIFAYGQTSSGKTWTLMGNPETHPGVTILAIKDIFQHVKAHPDIEWDVTCCYMEIYNETITDLLAKDRSRAHNLHIMEDKVFGPMPKGITTVGVHDTQHCLDVLRSGEEHRTFASTDMNANSSRSHTLFRLRIQGKIAMGNQSEVKKNMQHVADSLFDVRNQIRADRCSLFLIDHKAKEMYIQAGDITLRLPIGAGIAGTVAKRGEMICIADAYEDHRFNRNIDKKTGYRTRSILCMPVRSKRKVVGVVQYINKDGETGEFDETDIQKVRHMIDDLGPLIEMTQMMAKVTTTSGLNLVDLAGSERANKTGARGQQLKEGANINKSLMMLGRCIQMLSSGQKGHIPFRNSKLTRLLSTSLGGNAKTAIMCAFSPASRNRGETISTLQFASRAKTIVNKALKNQKRDNSELSAAYEEEIRILKQRLLEGSGGMGPNGSGGMTEEERRQYEQEKEEQEKRHAAEVDYLKEMQETTAQDYEMQMEALREEQARYEEQLLMHRRESRRMSQEVYKVTEKSSRRIAGLVSKNTLLQVRSRKVQRDVEAKQAALDEKDAQIRELKDKHTKALEAAEEQARAHQQDLRAREAQIVALQADHQQAMEARGQEIDALQATIDGLNARVASQEDALASSRARADAACKNALLTAGLVSNLEREMETLKKGTQVYREFFVKWQASANGSGDGNMGAGGNAANSVGEGEERG